MKKGLKFGKEETEVVSESQPTKTIQFITFVFTYQHLLARN